MNYVIHKIEGTKFDSGYPNCFLTVSLPDTGEMILAYNIEDARYGQGWSLRRSENGIFVNYFHSVMSNGKEEIFQTVCDILYSAARHTVKTGGSFPFTCNATL